MDQKKTDDLQTLSEDLRRLKQSVERETAGGFRPIAGASPFEEMLMLRMLNNDEAERGRAELLKVLENQNKVVEELAKKVSHIQKEESSTPSAELKGRIAQLEQRLLRHQAPKDSTDKMMEMFIYNLQSSMMMLPFVKTKQEIAQIQQEQMGDYLAQLRSANGMLNAIARSAPSNAPRHPAAHPPAAKTNNIQQYFQQIKSDLGKELKQASRLTQKPEQLQRKNMGAFELGGATPFAGQFKGLSAAGRNTLYSHSSLSKE